MKAISIKQPWASLIVEGIKTVENRAMVWKHRGPLAIHAGKTYDDQWPIWILDHFPDAMRIIDESKKLTGGIIGSVNMVDCVMRHPSAFFFGPMGYVLEDPKKCDLIPWKGKQGVMNICLDNGPGLRELARHFLGYYDCRYCGDLFHGYPIGGDCPTCGEFMLPF
jgi:hypothetical protein